MKYLKWFIVLVAGISMYVDAFEFPNTASNYDFTQTIQIFIVDQKNSKFFGMFDPFEIKVTTIPSRFYVAVMGVIERGHQNAVGVTTIDGPIHDHAYSVIFRSLNSAHVLHVGSNWVVDGNKMILLFPEEITAIYELLKSRSDAGAPFDMKKLEGLFNEIAQQIKADNSVSLDAELKSITDAANSIKERLPEGHDDTKTLPYYNKWMENQKLLEEQERARKLKEHQRAIKSQQQEKEYVKQGVTTPRINLPVPEESKLHKDPIYTDLKSTPKDTQSFLFPTFILIFLASFLYWIKRRYL